jgi:hypothetical protein
MHADPGEHLSAGRIWALVSIRQERVGDADGHELACLEGKRSRTLPAADDRIGPAAHTAANQPSASKGQLGNNGSYGSIRCVVGADRPICLEIVQLLWVAAVEIPDKCVETSGGVIFRLCPSVVALKGYSLARF